MDIVSRSVLLFGLLPFEQMTQWMTFIHARVMFVGNFKKGRIVYYEYRRFELIGYRSSLLIPFLEICISFL